MGRSAALPATHNRSATTTAIARGRLIGTREASQTSKAAKARWEQTRKPAGKSRAVIVRIGPQHVSYPSVTAAAKAAKVSRPAFYYGWLSKGKAWYADGPPPQ